MAEPQQDVEERLGSLLVEIQDKVRQSAVEVSGAQIGVFNGTMNFNGGKADVPSFAALRFTDVELAEVREQFVVPDGYQSAVAILRQHRVVVLQNRDTGREYAARRLLIDVGATSIIKARTDRDLESLKADDLESGCGYLWDGGVRGARPITDSGFSSCLGLLRNKGTWLVILLEDSQQVPEGEGAYVAHLTAPPARDIAQCKLRWLRPREPAEAQRVLGRLSEVLKDRDPPLRAARAAELAHEVAENRRNELTARAELSEQVEETAARCFRNLDITQRAMSLAVALLENEPYDEVVCSALELDKALRRAEQPKDEEVTPRKVFATQKRELLAAVRASVVRRDHPAYPGLSEETVRFNRGDWAPVVLRYAWEQYPDAQEVIRDWMCDKKVVARFSGPVRMALCTIVSVVPAHEPLALVWHLARKRTVRSQSLAADVLEQLARDELLRPLVRQVLEGWVADGPAYCQWVAAITYGSSFGRDDVRHTLGQLGAIARSPWTQPNEAVIAALLNMLRDHQHRETVLDTTLRWSVCGNQMARLVALNVGLWLAGFRNLVGFDTREFANSFPKRVRLLVDRVLTELKTAEFALERLENLVHKAEFDVEATEELVRLTTLIAGDLRWWRRLRTQFRLIRRFHHRRGQICWIFRHARRLQKQQQRGARTRARG